MSGSEESSETYEGALFIGLSVLLLINIVIGIVLESKHIKLIHETMIGLIFAITFGLAFKYFTGINITDTI